MTQKGIDLSPYADAEFLIEYSSTRPVAIKCKLWWKLHREPFPFSLDETFYVCPDDKTTKVLEVLFGKGTPRMIFFDHGYGRSELAMVGYD